ncbi:RES domain-containing protein [Chitinophaga sp.]|uniref:RES family NAD+ phosphorylase n=1 Tax=Chitinophaga sp. TaxID=1869181 RepID=UPI002620D9D2|nr:RES domain-containing protein [uncultured Chitinophaga sp.]
MWLYTLSRAPGSRKLLQSTGLSGRWNREEVPCRYLVGHPAMLIAETTALADPPGLPDHYFVVPIEVPDDSIRYFEDDELPELWTLFPIPIATQDFGSAHLKVADKLVLAFPSLAVNNEWIFVLNLAHPLVKTVKFGRSYPLRRQGGRYSDPIMN